VFSRANGLNRRRCVYVRHARRVPTYDDTKVVGFVGSDFGESETIAAAEGRMSVACRLCRDEYDDGSRQTVRDSRSDTVRSSQFSIHVRFANDASGRIRRIFYSSFDSRAEWFPR